MITLAVIQARMGSSRLPGKVLMDLGGASVLARVVGRLGRSQEITQIVVATTGAPADEAIVRECERLPGDMFPGVGGRRAGPVLPVLRGLIQQTQSCASPRIVP